MLRVHIDYVLNSFQVCDWERELQTTPCLQIVPSVRLTGAKKGMSPLELDQHIFCVEWKESQEDFHRQKFNSQNVSKGLWYYGSISSNLELGVTKVWKLVGMGNVCPCGLSMNLLNPLT